MLRLLVVLALACASHGSLYDGEASVITLTDSNFKGKVLDSSDVWIVEFFAPWCGHCKALVPEYVKAAEALKGIVKVGAIDSDAHKNTGGEYGVKGFPTIKLFGENKKAPVDFTGERTATFLAQAGLNAAHDVVMKRLGVSSGGSSSGNSKVIELTDSNFDEKVIKSTETWMVAFVAPWCGHCKTLHPNFDSAAEELDGKPFRLGRVDATVSTKLGESFQVKGYPTIKVFKNGTPEEYNGGRSKSDIVQFAENILEAIRPPPEVTQILNEKSFSEGCASKPLCLIAFFPPIFDSSAKQRNKFIDVMVNQTLRTSLKGFGFFWAEGLQQPALEKAFGIGDYPAMAALNGKKLRYAKMKGSFSKEELSGFIGRLMRSREATIEISEIPAISGVVAWDGKDAALAEAAEEEFSLDDLMGETLEKPEL